MPHPSQKRNSYNYIDQKHSSSNALLEDRKYSNTLNISVERSSGRRDSQHDPSCGEDQGTRVESPVPQINNFKHSSKENTLKIKNKINNRGKPKNNSSSVLNISQNKPKNKSQKTLKIKSVNSNRN